MNDDKDTLAVVSLVERARRDCYNSKTKQTKRFQLTYSKCYNASQNVFVF